MNPNSVPSARSAATASPEIPPAAGSSASAAPFTPRERIRNMLDGTPVDRPAYAAWGHVMNLDDRIASSFARATIDLQKAFQFDFIKVMSNPFYMLEDMGLPLLPPRRYDEPVRRDSERLPIQRPEDWNYVPFPQPSKGALARETEAVKRIADYFQGEVPVLPTIFTPMNWIEYLAVSERKMEEETAAHGNFTSYLERYMSENERYVRPALDRFCQITLQFMEDLLDAGADGFFYCTEHANSWWSGEEAFHHFERDYDLKLLNAGKERSFLTILHICGRRELRPEWVTDYPVQGISWEDQSPCNPSMKEMRVLTDKILVGGLDHHRDLKGTDEDQISRTISSKLKDAVESAGNRLIFSGGCAWDVEDVYRFGLWRDIMNAHRSC